MWLLEYISNAFTSMGNACKKLFNWLFSDTTPLATTQSKVRPYPIRIIFSNLTAASKKPFITPAEVSFKKMNVGLEDQISTLSTQMGSILQKIEIKMSVKSRQSSYLRSLRSFIQFWENGNRINIFSSDYVNNMLCLYHEMKTIKEIKEDKNLCEEIEDSFKQLKSKFKFWHWIHKETQLKQYKKEEMMNDDEEKLAWQENISNFEKRTLEEFNPRVKLIHSIPMATKTEEDTVYLYPVPKKESFYEIAFKDKYSNQINTFQVSQPLKQNIDNGPMTYLQKIKHFFLNLGEHSQVDTATEFFIKKLTLNKLNQQSEIEFILFSLDENLKNLNTAQLGLQAFVRLGLDNLTHFPDQAWRNRRIELLKDYFKYNQKLMKKVNRLETLCDEFYEQKQLNKIEWEPKVSLDEGVEIITSPRLSI